MTELLARHPDIDGVLAASDTTAAGALQVVCAAGRCGPQDVAVIGLDDFSSALCTKPRLTTARQSLDAMEQPSVAYRHGIPRTTSVVRERPEQRPPLCTGLDRPGLASAPGPKAPLEHVPVRAPGARKVVGNLFAVGGH